MSALLGNPMIATAAFPFTLGIALGLLSRLAVLRAAAVAVVLWGAAVMFLYWDTLGAPVFPPVSASQKLVWLGLVGILLGLVCLVVAGRRALAWLAAAAIFAAVAWIGWRRLSGGALDAVVLVAAVVLLLAMLGTLLALAAPPAPDAFDRFLIPAAVLAMALAGAIISVLGASIVVGQFLGSVAALIGGYCLVGYVAGLSGHPAGFGWNAGVEALMVFVAAAALLQTALLAPKAHPAALLLAPLPLLGPRLLAGNLRTLVPGSRAVGPLAAGLLIAIPAILAVIAAVIWAPEGAALGFS